MARYVGRSARTVLVLSLLNRALQVETGDESMTEHLLCYDAALAGDLDFARTCYANVLDVLGLPDAERQELMIGAAFVLAKCQRGEPAAHLLGALAQRLDQDRPGSELEDAMLVRVRQMLEETLSPVILADSMRRGASMTAAQLDALLGAELGNALAPF